MVRPTTISWIGYGYETSYAVADNADVAYGHGVRVTSLNRRNNLEKVFSMGSRNAQKLAIKQFEGALSTEHVLANPWFFKGVLGSVATTGSGPYYHTFSEADIVPSVTVANNYNMANDGEAQLLGAVFANCSITSAVGELVRVRLDQPYAKETYSGTTSSKLTESEECFSFAHGTVELPNGSTLAMVQNIELGISNSAELILGQGSRYAQEAAFKQRDYSGSITMALQQSSDLLEKFYGSSSGTNDTVAETASLQLTFTNGLTGTNERTIEMTYTGLQIDEESLPQDPTQVIMEDVQIAMRSLNVIATNNTTSSP